MAAPIYPPTPYYPIQLPANLKFIDPKGNPVSQLFPVAETAQLDTAQTSALSCNLAATNTLINQVTEINLILATYANTLASLQTQINNINTSGATALPLVNGGCLNGNTPTLLSTATTLLITNSCAYNTVLGTPTALANSILAQCTNLNTLPAFSQNSVMAGLAGWKTTPLTIADTITNEWLSYCDARAGITKALAAVTPSCSQVIVDFVANMPAFSTGLNLYFQGYTFIPIGFTDGGSSVVVTDGLGGILTQSINIITLSNTPGAYNLNTSGSTLSPTADSYTVTVTSIVADSSLGLTCQKTTIAIGVMVSGILVFTTLATGAAGPVTISANACCPDIGTYSFAITTSGITTLPIATGLSYTPRYVNIESLDLYTANTVYTRVCWVTPVFGGATLTVSNIAGFLNGTINLNWIAYR